MNLHVLSKTDSWEGKSVANLPDPDRKCVDNYFKNQSTVHRL